MNDTDYYDKMLFGPRPTPKTEAEPEPDLSSMDQAAYAEYRTQIGMPDGNRFGEQHGEFRHFTPEYLRACGLHMYHNEERPVGDLSSAAEFAGDVVGPSPRTQQAHERHGGRG